jgi:glyoxylase-like metal-dependent hydrolase (beta-lactamase superfamily II)
MDLVTFADSVVDTATATGPVNRITNELTVLDDDLAVVESFSHSWAARTDEGLVVFDASGPGTASRVVAALRSWSTAPVHTLVYTHGHVDHVGGVGAFLADAAERGHPRPRIVGHANVPLRLARYRLTNDYNVAINLRQFAPSRRRNADFGVAEQALRFLPDDAPDPDVDFVSELRLEVGGQHFVLRHDRGETDDHAWTEWEERATLFVGDMLVWNFPNCGNPQKVLRYPVEWAAALRKMIARSPLLVAPAHGLPVRTPARVERVLGTTADALELLVRGVIELLNADATLDDAIHTITVPDELLTLPWLRPFYDEPEFVVRNIWRTFGGWWDGNPAHLLPPRQRDLAREVAALAGGAGVLASRAADLAESGELRLAAELVEMAALAAPDSAEVHAARADVYARRRAEATSLMAKGIFEAAVGESSAIAGIEPPTMPRTHIL